jgi:hypothetical protein
MLSRLAEREIAALIDNVTGNNRFQETSDWTFWNALTASPCLLKR